VEENKSNQKQEKKTTKDMRLIVISFFLFGIGLVNFIMIYFANFMLIYLGVLGALSIAAGVELRVLKWWSFYLAVTTAMLQFVASLFTLLSSLLTAGSLNPSASTLVLNFVLLCWAVASIIATIILVISRSEFH